MMKDRFLTQAAGAAFQQWSWDTRRAPDGILTCLL